MHDYCSEGARAATPDKGVKVAALIPRHQHIQRKKNSVRRRCFYKRGNAGFGVILSGLDGNDVLGLGTFLALGHGELDFLAFGQGLEA